MFEKAALRVSYWRLKNYMIETLGYSEIHAVQSIGALRKVHPHILAEFLRWFYSAKLPHEPLFGVNIKALCDRRGLDPVAAFLAVDWVAREPEKAVRALSMPHDVLEMTRENQEELDALMAQNGWGALANEPVSPENESDLEVHPDNGTQT